MYKTVTFLQVPFVTACDRSLTLKCIKGGGQLGPLISFFASPVKMRIFWFGYASFGQKNDIGRAILTLISINGHYCTMSQNLFWPPFLNRIIFFKILFQKCKCIHVLQL